MKSSCYTSTLSAHYVLHTYVTQTLQSMLQVTNWTMTLVLDYDIVGHQEKDVLLLNVVNEQISRTELKLPSAYDVLFTEYLFLVGLLLIYYQAQLNRSFCYTCFTVYSSVGEKYFVKFLFNSLELSELGSEYTFATLVLWQFIFLCSRT